MQGLGACMISHLVIPQNVRNSFAETVTTKLLLWVSEMLGGCCGRKTRRRKRSQFNNCKPSSPNRLFMKEPMAKIKKIKHLSLAGIQLDCGLSSPATYKEPPCLINPPRLRRSKKRRKGSERSCGRTSFQARTVMKP